MTCLIFNFVFIQSLIVFSTLFTHSELYENSDDDDRILNEKKKSFIRMREFDLGDLMRTVALEELLFDSGMLPQLTEAITIPIDQSESAKKFSDVPHTISHHFGFRRHRELPHKTLFIMSKNGHSNDLNKKHHSTSKARKLMALGKRSLSKYCKKRQFDPICSTLSIPSFMSGKASPIVCPSGTCDPDVMPVMNAQLDQGLLVVPSDCPTGDFGCEENLKPAEKAMTPIPPPLKPFQTPSIPYQPPSQPQFTTPSIPNEDPPLRIHHEVEPTTCNDMYHGCVEVNGNIFKLVPITKNSKPCVNSEYLISKNCAKSLRDIGEQPIWHEKIADCPTIYLEFALKNNANPTEINEGIDNSLKGRGCQTSEKIAKAISNIAKALSENGCCNNKEKRMISVGGACD